MESEQTTGRREFLMAMAGAPAAAFAGGTPATPFCGIQMGSHTILDKGIERRHPCRRVRRWGESCPTFGFAITPSGSATPASATPWWTARATTRTANLFAELAGPVRKRGMKLYARVLEGMKFGYDPRSEPKLD